MVEWRRMYSNKEVGEVRSVFFPHGFVFFVLVFRLLLWSSCGAFVVLLYLRVFFGVVSATLLQVLSLLQFLLMVLTLVMGFDLVNTVLSSGACLVSLVGLLFSYLFAHGICCFRC